MREVIDEYEDRMMVGEVYLPVERLVSYYGGGSGVHMPFNFQLIELPWNARVIQDAVNKYEALLPSYGWPNWVLSNHDQPLCRFYDRGSVAADSRRSCACQRGKG